MLWKNICKILDTPVPVSIESQEKFLLPTQKLLDCRKRSHLPQMRIIKKVVPENYISMDYSIVLTIANFPLHKYTDPSKKCLLQLQFMFYACSIFLAFFFSFFFFFNIYHTHCMNTRVHYYTYIHDSYIWSLSHFVPYWRRLI
jgi:hypothetical protein